jgi:hypothetical protein
MKQIRHQYILVLALFLGLTAPAAQVQAQTVSCHKAYSSEKAIDRDQVAGFAVRHNIPALETSSQVPILLLNKETVKAMLPLLQNSIGIQVALQPNWKNDHGLLRVGTSIIDMDTPGARSFGELYETGLAWKDVQEYTARKNNNAYKVIEVVYTLTPQEQQTASVYQRVRRAALYRVPFTFGGGKANNNYPNMVPHGGENCFSFCRGTSLSSQISYMQAEVQKLTGRSYEELKTIEPVLQFLNQAIQKIANVRDVNSKDELNNSMLMNLKETKATLDLLAPEKPEQEKQVLLNWIVSLETSLRYANLLRNLGVGGGNGWEGSTNTRATAILVHDVTASREQFVDPNYTLPGVFNTWKHADTRPLREVEPQEIVALVKAANRGWIGKLVQFFQRQ